MIDVTTVSNGSEVLGHFPPPEKPPGKSYEGHEHIPEVVRLLREEANVI